MWLCQLDACPSHPSLVLLLVLEPSSHLDLLSTLEFYLIPPAIQVNVEDILKLFILIMDGCPSEECEIFRSSQVQYAYYYFYFCLSKTELHAVKLKI